jgi:hypothetical protein
MTARGRLYCGRNGAILILMATTRGPRAYRRVGLFILMVTTRGHLIDDSRERAACLQVCRALL